MHSLNLLAQPRTKNTPPGPNMIISQNAAKLLERIKQKELLALTEKESLANTDALLSLAASAKYPSTREQSLGLIECQRILYNVK